MPIDEENGEIFEIVHNAYNTLIIDEKNQKLIEILTVARVLYQLGYLSCIPIYRGLIDSFDFDEEIIKRVITVENDMVDAINSGLAESQL
tara:strand:- start:952 stop:1221 length:270 start_codon:yes stop_codon:yes gene_type:complete